MFERGMKLRRCSPLLTALILLTAAAPAFGFGGHPFPPPTAPIVPVVQVIPDQPTDGSGGPTPDTEPIPPLLLEPTVDDILPPTFTDGGDVGPTLPPDGTPPNSTPEPATVMMGLLGAGFFAAWTRRRRRSK